jgi:NAD(P)-dependent dehydrogenase (short-subunit alcohol dehydrogenase family)
LGDATREEDVVRIFEHGFLPSPDRQQPDLVVFNTGANQPIDFRSLEAADFEKFWRVGCYAGFLVGREAARHMAPLGRGTILFTGASASLRGKPRYAHFAAAKAGLRVVAQSMAREFGPMGVHVAHVVIDGGIDGDVLRAGWPDVVAARGEDGLLQTTAIADTYWAIHRQPRSAWTHEVDLRPYKEHF